MNASDSNLAQSVNAPFLTGDKQMFAIPTTDKRLTYAERIAAIRRGQAILREAAIKNGLRDAEGNVAKKPTLREPTPCDRRLTYAERIAAIRKGQAVLREAAIANGLR